MIHRHKFICYILKIRWPSEIYIYYELHFSCVEIFFFLQHFKLENRSLRSLREILRTGKMQPWAASCQLFISFYHQCLLYLMKKSNFSQLGAWSLPSRKKCYFCNEIVITCFTVFKICLQHNFFKIHQTFFRFIK